MTTEQTAQLQQTEANSPPVETVGQAFVAANHNLYKLTADPAFHAGLIDIGIDPYDDTETLPYWQTLSEYAQQRVGTLRETHGDSPRLHAFELITATPGFLLSEHALDTKQALAIERPMLKDTTARFNELLSDFAQSYPEIPVSTVLVGVLSVVNKAISYRPLREASADLVRRHLRGMQHELGVGQSLDAAHRQFRPSTREEDLQGIDYVVAGRHSVMPIDIKASAEGLRQHRDNDGVSAKHGGIYVIRSPFGDGDFHDRFFVTEARAAEQAPKLDALLDRLEIAHLSGKATLTYTA